jgi:hypothetical protein
MDYKDHVDSPNIFCCDEKRGPPSVKGCCGLPKRSRWVTGGKLAMVIK